MHSNVPELEIKGTSYKCYSLTLFYNLSNTPFSNEWWSGIVHFCRRLSLFTYSGTPPKGHLWNEDTSPIRTLDQVPTPYKYVLSSPWNENASLISSGSLRVSVLEGFRCNHFHPCVSNKRAPCNPLVYVHTPSGNYTRLLSEPLTLHVSTHRRSEIRS